MLALALFFLWLYGLYTSPSARVKRLAPFDGPFVVARRKLIVSLFGDYKAADRLIAFEQSKGSCTWLEAAIRACESLERDRSRS